MNAKTAFFALAAAWLAAPAAHAFPLPPLDAAPSRIEKVCFLWIGCNQPQRQTSPSAAAQQQAAQRAAQQQAAQQQLQTRVNQQRLIANDGAGVINPGNRTGILSDQGGGMRR